MWRTCQVAARRLTAPPPWFTESGFKASPCVTMGKSCLMIRAPASFRRGKPLTMSRNSLKTRGTLSEADQLSFFNSLLCLIYKATCSLLESEQLCCVQTGWKCAWVSAWELTLSAVVDLSCTEVIFTQFSVNPRSTVWKLPENALTGEHPWIKLACGVRNRFFCHKISRSSVLLW